MGLRLVGFKTMGKRSNFQRKPRDFYKTPVAAVEPLRPYLRNAQTFCEPCAGDGALVGSLLTMGLNCASAYDIDPQQTGIKKLDAKLLEKKHLSGADLIITNPPWDRKVLHPMIERFSNLCPTWLLFDADWVHTKQAVPYLPRLRKIVSIGRVKWFENTTGKDNSCWHLFDRHDKTHTTIFFGRAQ